VIWLDSKFQNNFKVNLTSDGLESPRCTILFTADILMVLYHIVLQFFLINVSSLERDWTYCFVGSIQNFHVFFIIVILFLK